MKFILKLIGSTLAVFVTAYVLTGVTVDSYITAAIVAIVLGVVNTFIKPILVLLTLPISLITMGLFGFAINAGLILLVAYFVEGFGVDSFWWALAFSVVQGLVAAFLHKLID